MLNLCSSWTVASESREPNGEANQSNYAHYYVLPATDICHNAWMTQRGFGPDQNYLLQESPVHGQQTSPVFFIGTTGLRVRSLVFQLETSVGIETVASIFVTDTPPLLSVFLCLPLHLGWGFPCSFSLPQTVVCVFSILLLNGRIPFSTSGTNWIFWS